MDGKPVTATFNETAHWCFESVNPTAWVEQKYS